MVFFAKDKKGAISYAKKIAKKEGLTYSEPKLAKKQYKHISDFRTWTGGWK